MEYLYDGRGPGESVTEFDNDVVLVTRLALSGAQDSSVLVGEIFDTGFPAPFTVSTLPERFLVFHPQPMPHFAGFVK